MTERRLKKLFPNPFYVVLLISSTLFVVTALAWLVVPSILDQAAAPQAKGGLVGLARWVDHNGTVALGGEVAVMLAAALLAMLTDRWFPERPAPRA